MAFVDGEELAKLRQQARYRRDIGEIQARYRRGAGQAAAEPRWASSPHSLPCISPASRLHLACISPISRQVAMLAEMGFEPTLCQKAVGMFGDDMGAAVAWLTDDQAQHTLRRSP